ncbi:primosomal protein DnaI [Tuberibacillus sp. Marseille-P3662]|uniref:primosomal protein DnaI n=1 Tax=Tuberibacillus sp. Marseille-P3662 TaxID=1965358 RepID=UPI000A1CA002|nr:primosomal protein DnaI [Tuberibacillus sp. Marseille-P3662]
MKSIQSTIKELAGDRGLLQQYHTLYQKVLEDERMQTFLHDNPGTTTTMIQRSLPQVHEYLEGREACDHCPGLEHCPNVMKGYQPSMTIDKGSLSVSYHPCQLKRAAEQKRKQSQLIQSFYVPSDVLNATFQTIDKMDPGRQDALEAAGQFVSNYMQDPGRAKGLFIHGMFGVGKTYIMGAIMNALAMRAGVESLMVYTPDFFREIKGAIQQNNLDEKLSYIKDVPVLILDDIGAETMSPWVRDEVLGSILQYRMMQNLPTLYTSNSDYDELEEHLAYSNKSGTELVKAKRIMERLRHYTHAVKVSGNNRREQM